jgi:MoxR-like ATPase
MPTTALLVGPEGVGRFTVASSIAQKVSGGRHLILDRLTAESAESLSAWSLRKAARQIAVVRSDNATKQGWNKLLKVLEELPSGTHVWIVGSASVPVAIRSRCTPIHFQYLDPEEVRAHALSTGLVEQEELDLMPSQVFRSFAELAAERSQLRWLSNVRAWVDGVEHGSREEVFDAVASWSKSASVLLLRELEAQYESSTILGKLLTRTNKDSLIRAIAEVANGSSPKVSALVAGTFLIDKT